MTEIRRDAQVAIAAVAQPPYPAATSRMGSTDMRSRSLLDVLLVAIWLIVASSRAASAELPTPDSAAATVGSTAVPWSVVDSATGEGLARAQHDRDSQARRIDLQYAQSRAKIISESVEQLLDEKVLSLEAQELHSTPEALLGALTPEPVSEAAVSDFYASHRRQITQPLAKVAPQLREYMEKESRKRAESAYLKGLRSKYHAVSHVPPLRIPVAADGPARGPAAAPVTVIEFGDFQCPYCGEMEPVLRELRATYPTEVRWVFRHLPLTSIHPQAVVAARAAVCAEQQGKFWEMHDALYANQAALGEDAIKATARSIGLDGSRFDACSSSDAADATLTRDSAAADAIGIGGTPAFFINGRFLNGTTTAAGFREILDDELARRGVTAPTPAISPAR